MGEGGWGFESERVLTMYVSDPKLLVDDVSMQAEVLGPRSMDVHAAEPERRRTGLVDHRGHAIFSVAPTRPVGFGHSYKD